MAIHDAHVFDPHPDENVVHVYGEPEDVENIIGRETVDSILIAGYDVKNVVDAQHDGFPAKRFTLMADGTEIGRLVLRTGVPTEYTFEFDAQFVNAKAAEQFVDRVHNPPAPSKVIVVHEDLAYNEETVTEAIANLSAQYGVSIMVIEPEGPGGGWPMVQILGTVEKVRGVLADAWSYSADEIDARIAISTGA